jgi:predicted Zn-dependent protease
MRTSLAYSFILLLMLATSCRKDPEPDSGQNGTTSSADDFVRPNHFLAADKYDRLIIEIQYVKGFEPTVNAINNLKTFLGQRINKPQGIEVMIKEVVSPGNAAYSLTDITAHENASRTQHASEKTLTAYVFFVDGAYSANSGNSSVLGFAYATSSIVIFEKTVQDFSGGISQPSTSSLETIVLNHEFGHTLGLVNRGTPLQSAHVDAAHANHCNNPDCLMYYEAETSDLAGNLPGRGVSSLDAACIADLKANGGK